MEQHSWTPTKWEHSSGMWTVEKMDPMTASMRRWNPDTPYLVSGNYAIARTEEERATMVTKQFETLVEAKAWVERQVNVEVPLVRIMGVYGGGHFELPAGLQSAPYMIGGSSMGRVSATHIAGQQGAGGAS